MPERSVTRERTQPVILLVASDAATRDLLRDGLGRHGFEVVLPGRYEDPLYIITSARPVAVMLDLTLPSGSGIQIASEWRALGLDYAPIIAIADSRAKLDVEWLNGLFDLYLEKPLRLEEVVDQLRTLIATPR